MNNKPKSGDIVMCDKCGVCHRLTHPKHRKTGGFVTSVLVCNCNGFLRIGARDRVLLPGLEIIEPVGDSSTVKNDIVKLRKEVSPRYRNREVGAV